MMGWGPYWGAGGWLGMLLGPIIWIIILVVIGGFVSQFFSRPLWNRRDAPRHDTPLEILKRRYANGEISQAEFEGMKRELGEG